MKKIFTSVLLALAILSLSGCGEETNDIQTQNSEITSSAAKEATTAATKCAADGKCGAGKCGSSTNKMNP